MVDLVNTTNGITRLNNHNYQSWRSCIKSYLEGQDLWEVIEGNDNKPPGNFYTLRTWKVKAGKVMYVLKSTIEDELLQQIKDDDTPKMAWDTFASLFSNTNDADQLKCGIRPVEMDTARMIDPELYKAAKEGDVHCITEIDGGGNMTEEEAMTDQHGNFLKRTQYGNNNILHIAARAGRVNFVEKVLCRFPFLSDQVNSQGDTPLLVAARFGHLKVVKKLIESEEMKELVESEEVKELTEGATENRPPPVSILPASYNKTRRRISPPPPPRPPPRDWEEDRVDHPLEVGNIPIVMSTDLENQTNSSISHPQSDAEEDRVDHPLEVGNIPVGMATDLENQTNSSNSHHRREVGEGIVDHQSEQGTIPDSIVINMEGTAVEYGPVLIPSYWRVINSEGTTVTTALHEAIRNGHEDVARYLLRLIPNMANVDNLAGESPLFLAAESRCLLFMTDILLSKRPYSTKGPNGLNVLHALHDCGAIISLLIKEKPDLMRQLDNHGKAAIHHAVEADYWVLMSRMLEADPSIALFPDADGYTALLTASRRGCWKACESILKICPESIEARDHKGRNALHLCSIKNYWSRFVKIPEIWELLNVGDDEGNTPLHVAVNENQFEKAMLLISSVSIDLGAVNKEGLTALDLCESDWMHFNKKRLMWFHLRRYGAPRGRRPNKHKVPVGGPKGVIRSPDEDRKPIINTMSVVAALIVTLTFAAAFTMPGGYDSSPDNLGGATLVKKAALIAFILSDTLAMCCSITVVSLLWTAMRVEEDLKFSLTNTSVILLNIAIYATLVAFMSGVFAVIAPKALWVAILVCVVGSLIFCLMTPERVMRSSLSAWFMPTVITRDILRFIQLTQLRNKRKRDQRYVLSLIERFPRDTSNRHTFLATVYHTLTHMWVVMWSYRGPHGPLVSQEAEGADGMFSPPSGPVFEI